MYTGFKESFSRLNSYSQVPGLRTARLHNIPNLYNFALESERTSSYSHSWRAGALEDTEREVCAGSQRIRATAKQHRRRFHG